jgi:hypothetical protein
MMVKRFLVSRGVLEINDPPYSLDLAPVYFFGSLKWQEFLKEEDFRTLRVSRRT